MTHSIKELETILGLGGPEYTGNIAGEVAAAFADTDSAKKGLAVSTSDILAQIDKLQQEVQNLRHSGISMWNYKDAIPKIFDIVDGGFLIMAELAKNQKE